MMPLKKGWSKKAIGFNIGIEEKHGKPPKQAIAIAFAEADRARKLAAIKGWNGKKRKRSR